jgi:hypothetical protein
MTAVSNGFRLHLITPEGLRALAMSDIILAFAFEQCLKFYEPQGKKENGA